MTSEFATPYARLIELLARANAIRAAHGATPRPAEGGPGTATRLSIIRAARGGPPAVSPRFSSYFVQANAAEELNRSLVEGLTSAGFTVVVDEVVASGPEDLRRLVDYFKARYKEFSVEGDER